MTAERFDLPWVPCWLRRLAARLSGVRWDGHCWSESGTFCIDAILAGARDPMSVAQAAVGR